MEDLSKIGMKNNERLDGDFIERKLYSSIWILIRGILSRTTK
jgi:hypothetical protein